MVAVDPARAWRTRHHFNHTGGFDSQCLLINCDLHTRFHQWRLIEGQRRVNCQLVIGYGHQRSGRGPANHALDLLDAHRKGRYKNDFIDRNLHTELAPRSLQVGAEPMRSIRGQPSVELGNRLRINGRPNGLFAFQACGPYCCFG